jgi:hypothetical protein
LIIRLKFCRGITDNADKGIALFRMPAGKAEKNDAANAVKVALQKLIVTQAQF